MRHKALEVRKNPLNLTRALIHFGKLRTEHPECVESVKLGERLVREIQYLHKLLRDVRKTFPDTYNDYVDPSRLDTALARTCVYEPVEY